MEPFLEKLAGSLFQKYGENIHRLCIVLPNRRAGLFLKQYFSKLISRPIWLPEISALEDFVVMKSGLQVPDQLSLLVRLYHVYKSIEKDKAKSFAEFLSSATMLLSDFDEIDQYLANGEEVFAYLDELKALKHWNPDGTPLTPFEREYLQFYNSLAPLYREFGRQLLAEGEGYFGLAFRQLIEKLDNEPFGEWQKVIFAGFNALTSAEEKLFRFLQESGKGEIFWDADEYYVSDSRQEAGHFLRDYFTSGKFGTMNWIGQDLLLEEKNISVIGVPGNVGQAKLAGQLTAEVVAATGNASDVALILVDEGLMLPVLNSIPPDLKDFNLTMGYPLKLTPVFSLLDALFLLFINAGRYAEKKIIPDGKVSISPRFHYRDIKRFLGHPYLGTAPFPGDPPGRKQKEKLNKSFYKADELFRLLNTAQPGLSEVFREDDSAAGFSPGYLAGLMQALITFFRDRFVADDAASGKEVHRIDIEYLYHFALLLKRIQLLTAETDLVDKSETLYEIFTGLVTGMRLPFYGEPLKGLQIMGMLETRTLDFRNIIMLSVNEGLLPKGKHQNTFIPDEVRKEFGLQLYNERNAVFAYHFYRLLQRSSSIHLLYNTEGNDLGGGEMSRFISQIRLELPSYNPKIHISGRLLSVPAMQLSDAAVSIAKDEAVLERLGELAEKGFSPTGLSRYLACSLQFCYAQVLKITEPEQLDETIDAATLGEVVHAVLYQSYKPFLGQKVTPSELESILPSAIAGVKAEFSSRYPVSELESGKNLLIVKVAENMIKRFLLAESAYLEKLPAGQQSAEILNLESGLEAMIRVPDLATGELREVKIKGQADRIDKVDGKLRVIDYKTGRLDDAEVKLDSVKLLREHKNPAKLLQLLTYAWMYTRMNPGQQANELVSGIISLRMSSRYLMNARIGTEDKLSNSQLSDFETLLSDVLSEIFNPDIPFIRTEHTENCRYCAYQSLCNRVVN